MKRRKKWEATMLKGTERWQTRMHEFEMCDGSWKCLWKLMLCMQVLGTLHMICLTLYSQAVSLSILRGEGCQQVLGSRNTGYETEGYRKIWGISFNEAMKNQGREGKKGNMWQPCERSRSLKKVNRAQKWKKQIRF